jgi:hypothetical protein
MDGVRGPGPRLPAGRRAGRLALITALAGLAAAGCQARSSPGPAVPSPGGASAGTATASPGPGFSVPGTHRTTRTYQISSPVSTVVVTGHAGNVTVTGGSGPGISVTEEADYSKTSPVTTRTVSGSTLTVTYSCATQVVCGVAYTLEVPRNVTLRVTAGAGSIRLGGLAGSVTAEADVGLMDATGLTGASVSLTTDVGGISASFAAAPATVQASARVGTITLHVPGTMSYKVTANAHVGKAAVSIIQNATSAHAITATTDVGAINIAPS